MEFPENLSSPTSDAQSSQSEAVPKSDTDYTLTTESGEPTPNTDVWRNPLDEEEEILLKTPTLPEETSESFSCSTCGMHRSWAAASLLMSVCGKADVLRDAFSSEGAIPSTMNDWQRLIRHVAGFTDKERDLTAMCPRCEMSLSSVERVCNDGWRTMMGGAVEEGVKPNADRIFERCMNTSKEKLRAIIERRSENASEVQEPSEVPSETPEVSTDSSESTSSSSGSFDLLLPAQLFQWTRATSLRTILALAVFCIGKKSVLHIVSSDEKWIARKMSPADWCAIVIMGARESGFRDLLSGKVGLEAINLEF